MREQVPQSIVPRSRVGVVFGSRSFNYFAMSKALPYFFPLPKKPDLKHTRFFMARFCS